MEKGNVIIHQANGKMYALVDVPEGAHSFEYIHGVDGIQFKLSTNHYDSIYFDGNGNYIVVGLYNDLNQYDVRKLVTNLGGSTKTWYQNYMDANTNFTKPSDSLRSLIRLHGFKNCLILRKI